MLKRSVETEEQSRLLRLLGCDEVQGFLFSESLPISTFEARYLAPGPLAGAPLPQREYEALDHILRPVALA